MQTRPPKPPLVPSLRSTGDLRERFAELEQVVGARALAVAISDFETGTEFDFNGDRWFHAASTIKLAVLVGVYGAIHRGELLLQSRVHIRNRFLSAYDGSPYRVRGDRDANAEVHREIGRTLRVSELADYMITSSSNLATNLLLDLVGLDVLQRTLDGFGLEGIDLRRGVEDELAYQTRHQQPRHGTRPRRTACASSKKSARSVRRCRARCWTSCTGSSSGVGFPPACRAKRVSRTRPAISPPSRTTPASSICRDGSRMRLPC